LPESVVAEPRSAVSLPAPIVQSLFDTIDRCILVAERAGRIVMANARARQMLKFSEGQYSNFNLFSDLLHVDPKVIAGQFESGEHEIDLQIQYGETVVRSRIQWLPEPDWLILQAELPDVVTGESGEQLTVQGLLQEREITYRNLLAAYLRLQEVNRQKTVFLASAAHELKTPLAVIKGYYDLLLSGSLGKLSDKQREILQESKESSERLVRLVSMFLNYSALESGKLVLLLHDNDMRDCLGELATRWND